MIEEKEIALDLNQSCMQYFKCIDESLIMKIYDMTFSSIEVTQLMYNSLQKKLGTIS
jgi:hypothetical protein